MIAVKFTRRRRLLIAISMITCMAILIVFAVDNLSAVPKGPFQCDQCRLDHPSPNAETERFVRKNMAIAEKMWPVSYLVGTEYLICNRTHCIEYQVNFNDKLISSKPPYRRVGAPGSRVPPPPPMRPSPPPRRTPGPPPPGGEACVRVGKVTTCTPRPN